MGKNKKYLIKTINLGTPENVSRILSEKYIKMYGKNAFSSLVRKLIVMYLSQDTKFDDWKVDALVQERKKMAEDLKILSDKMCQNAEKLEKMGITL